MSKIGKILLVVCSLIIGMFVFIFAFWNGAFDFLDAILDAREIATYSSPDGEYSLIFEQIGDPEWPFGPTDVRLTLKNQEGKVIERVSDQLSADGANAGEHNIVSISWKDDEVIVVLGASEMKDKEVCLSFEVRGQDAGTDKDSEQLEDEKRTEVEKPYDVPKVLIYTDGEEITKDAYIDCKITIIDEEGGTYQTIRDDASTVKIRGNSTSSGAKKPYNIKFSEKTDVLGMGANKKWALLANCYDKTLIRNLVVFDVAKQLNVPFTPDYKVVDVYVDDVLQGNYLMVDSIEAGPTRVDIDTSKNEFLLELDYNPKDEDYQYFLSSQYGIRFAINEPEIEDLTEEQFTYVKDLVTKAEKALSTGNMAEIEQYFDIESMANFYLTLEFFRNVDVNTSSTRFHIKDGKIFGGPVWDFDLSAGNYRWDYYTTMHDHWGRNYAGLHAVTMPWFGALVKVEEFQNIVNQKFLDHQDIFVNLYEDNVNGQNHIDETISAYEASISRNYGEAGWDVSKVYKENFLERYPEPTYEENVEYFRKWLRKRNEWLLKTWGLNTP